MERQRPQLEKRGLLAWLWRAAVALVVPPLAMLVVFFIGLSIDGIATDFPGIRFMSVILITGPLALASGVGAAASLSLLLLGASRRGWKLAFAASVLVIYLAWSQAFLRFARWGS